MNKNVAIVICGPTAVGKTAFAVEVARQLDTSIISADSRQCFSELNIGVAKPSARELALVHHYFINSHSIFNEVNAGIFEQYALDKSAELFRENKPVVIAGGTGLYIKAFCGGLDEIPFIEPAIRQQVIDEYNHYGLVHLQQKIKQVDIEFWNSGEKENPQRLMRALEVFLSTGKSIRSFQKGGAGKRNFEIVKIGLELPRDLLYSRINKRVDVMMQMGLLNEVSALRPFKHLNPLQTVGYQELFEHLEGNLPLQAAIEKIKTNTRHYAKRQMTWFKRDPQIRWIDMRNNDAGVLVQELKHLTLQNC